MYCKKCGKQIVDEAIVCPYCGVPTDNYPVSQQAQPAPNASVETAATSPEAKKNVAPILLGIIGGIIGGISGFIWMLVNLVGSSTFGGGSLSYAILYLFLGSIGAILGLIGAILAGKNKIAGVVLLGIGLLAQVGVLICNFAELKGKNVSLTFLVSLGTIFALIFFGMALIFAIIGVVNRNKNSK